MNPKSKIILSLVAAIFIGLCSLSYAGQYEVIRVVDGDTIIVNFNGKKERVRMLCVDTPESVHPDPAKNTERGRQAAAYTRSRLAGKKVDLVFESKTRGKYNRLLAYVFIDGINFNVELVKKGWSKYYTKYGISEKYHAELIAAEKEFLSIIYKEI